MKPLLDHYIGVVMPAPGAGIHDFKNRVTQDVDDRDKPGHDEVETQGEPEPT